MNAASPSVRIGLVHAVAAAMAPIAMAFREQWPEATLANLLDDSLSGDRAAIGLTPDMTRRIAELAEYCVHGGAKGVLFTCSAFGPAIDAAAARLEVPVLKPNEAMFLEALDRGTSVGMIATFAPAIATMEEEFREAARDLGKSAGIRSVLAAGALDALNAGKPEEHDRLVAEASKQLEDCDVVMLAQFSMARALDAVQNVSPREVLASPASAVRAMKRAIAVPAR